MRLYDSMTQEKKDFVPRDGDHVTMYFCGPTVYNYVHVGNARPYVVSMVAKRYFESLGYRVTLVENITDIDDRIIQKGMNGGGPASEVAAEFAQAYRDDTDRLGLGRPDVEPLATEHIQEIIDLIATLVERGHAYQSGVRRLLRRAQQPELRQALQAAGGRRCAHGARISVGEDKTDPLDFALWKGAKPGEPAWESPWGPGRPGWHIECSAMSMKYLGAGFDIHGGGRDLIFPHHENEIAQAEGALDTAVRALLDAQRHAQPERREDVEEPGQHSERCGDVLDTHRPEALIAAFLSSHYRSPMEFSAELLEEAEQQVDRLRNVFRGNWPDACGRRAPNSARGAAGASSGCGSRWPPAGRPSPTPWPTTSTPLPRWPRSLELAREANIALAAG